MGGEERQDFVVPTFWGYWMGALARRRDFIYLWGFLLLECDLVIKEGFTGTHE